MAPAICDRSCFSFFALPDASAPTTSIRYELVLPEETLLGVWSSSFDMAMLGGILGKLSGFDGPRPKWNMLPSTLVLHFGDQVGRGSTEAPSHLDCYLKIAISSFSFWDSLSIDTLERGNYFNSIPGLDLVDRHGLIGRSGLLAFFPTLSSKVGMDILLIRAAKGGLSYLLSTDPIWYD